MRHTGWLIGVLLLAGCGTGSADVLDSTEIVCDDFAHFIRDGRPADQRSDVISGIGDVIGNADSGVRDAYGVLTNTVNDTSSQPIADDTFAQACFDAGWES